MSCNTFVVFFEIHNTSETKYKLYYMINNPVYLENQKQERQEYQNKMSKTETIWLKSKN